MKTNYFSAGKNLRLVQVLSLPPCLTIKPLPFAPRAIAPQASILRHSESSLLPENMKCPATIDQNWPDDWSVKCQYSEWRVVIVSLLISAVDIVMGLRSVYGNCWGSLTLSLCLRMFLYYVVWCLFRVEIIKRKISTLISVKVKIALHNMELYFYSKPVSCIT